MYNIGKGSESMAKSYGQKLKLLYISQYLCENSDQDHTVTVNDIIAYLESLGINAERKAIYDDLECLRTFGLDIEMQKTASRAGYYIASRDFELSELKLLVDAVQGSRFITQKKSDMLMRKLEKLCSRYEAAELSRQTLMANRIKSMNESIYYNVDKLHKAIGQDKIITFNYFDYDIKKQRVLRHDGKQYKVSPFALNWDDENYYLVAYDLESKDIRHYRVDKMLSISITGATRVGKEEFNKVDVQQYSQRVFSMFAGTTKNVCIEFDESLCGAVIDRFGSDVMLRKSENDGKICVHCKVDVSPHFFGWLFSFGNKVKILTPSELEQEFVDYLKDVAKIYAK